MNDNIKVVVKVRPLISREIEDKLSYQWRVKNNELYQLNQNGRDTAHFTFDKVYDKHTKTSEIYDDIAKPIVEAAIAGFNGTIFAYGQTSSGKTYTMTGTEETPGIIPLAVHNLYQNIKNIPDRDFLVRVSYIEIYNEIVKDLLRTEQNCAEKKGLKILENYNGGVKVEDCEEKMTTSPEEVLKILKEGEANRQIGATNMNEESSRSHSIFQITIESREHIEGEEDFGCVNVSTLNLVDLAGSERAGQTGARGIRFVEGTHINKSLSTLALVIKQLSEDQTKHVNYRDSKLTRILQNSLGGNAKTCIICAITPAALEETISTLQFANRAKAIKNKPKVNAVTTNATMIQSLTKQLSKLQSQLECKKDKENNLQKQIAALQKLILNGFGHRGSMDMTAGNRRKLIPPRRVTISTLNLTDEDPVPIIPKFHTPVLKYNPMLLSGTADFIPIQNTTKLTSVTEEPENRLITPPPREKKIDFNSEVIDLDSDDDNETDVQTCSPYHKCHDHSKTPPCILRKNAKLAERNLKDIVELTEREKIYSPDVVEFMEKIEQNTSEIARLEDEIVRLKKICQAKDLEIEQFQSKEIKFREDIKSATTAKSELETLCKEYTRKLTDWEASYETLKKKTKSREEELLSLLDEHQKTHKKGEDADKILLKNLEKEINFMDLSKDISLVNSDTETSIANVNDNEASSQLQDLVLDMENQLSSKKNILEVETNLRIEERKLKTLENASQEMQEMFDSFKEKFSLLENENALLKATIDQLNSTIKSQTESLDSANNDRDSYNSVIQELHMRLTNKEKNLSVNINDITLENMIANEEKFIANNDNIKNIIHSFKIALNTRNNEIQSLKASAQNNPLPNESDTVKDELNNKKDEIEKLQEKILSLEYKASENITLIDKLVQEKNKLAELEHRLVIELDNLTKERDQLVTNSKDNSLHVSSLEKEIEKLTVDLAERDNIKAELTNKIEDQVQTIKKLNANIIDLNTDIKSKDDMIKSLQKDDKQLHECLSRARSYLLAMNSILSKVAGNMQDVPNTVDNIVDILNILGDNLSVLDSVSEIFLKKDEQLQDNLKIKIDLELSNEKLTKELERLKIEFKALNESEQVLNKQNKDMIEQIDKLVYERDDIHQELEAILTENKYLQPCDESIIECLQNKDVLKEIKCLKLILFGEDNKMVRLHKDIEKLENTIESKSLEIDSLKIKLQETIENQSTLLNSIFDRSVALFNLITDNTSTEYDDKNTYEKILFILNKIVTKFNSVDAKNENNLSEVKRDIEDMTNRNKHLLEKNAHMGDTNNMLIKELEQIQIENKKLNEDLTESNDTLEVLRKELTEKSISIENMVLKTQALEEHFSGLDSVIKNQISDLETDKGTLKNRCSQLEILVNDSKDNIELLSSDDYYDKIDIKPDVNQDKILENKYPPSLLTCGNKIVESIQPSENSASFTDSNIEYGNKEQQNCVNCYKVLSNLKVMQTENARILKDMEQLKSQNEQLVAEQEQVRQEVQLLLEPAYALQKKINSHKTNLSTLTATTYAENKSLKSQVTALQHYHSRFHNVCQRDIPVVKKQLHRLLSILKNENSHIDKTNASFKRYSLPSILDNSSSPNANKNESTLDGDLLMLDTNVTLTTSADNTLLGIDQICLDLTQVYANNDISCHINESQNASVIIDSQLKMLTDDNNKQSRAIELLELENNILKEQINKASSGNYSYTDSQTSPIKHSKSLLDYEHCASCADLKAKQESLNEEIKLISQELNYTKILKEDISQKYNNLTLEIPSTEALVRKLNVLDKEFNNKVQEITRLTNVLNSKNIELKQLQQENDSLSIQVMDNISESDDLNRELNKMKTQNGVLLEKCSNLELLIKGAGQDRNKIVNCEQCILKDENIKSLHNIELHSKLSRSMSDSDTSSRYNKFCTLQSELHAGREDCKELTEDVATIKNHLERSNLSIGQNMDLDESLGEPNIFTFTKHFDSADSQLNKISLNESRDRQLDAYTIEKMDCINYYVEITGVDKENLDCKVKIIELMKMFYNNCLAKHNNQIENLVNKIKCYEESKGKMETQINDISAKYSKITNTLQEKENSITSVTKVLSQVKECLSTINNEIANVTNEDNKDINLVNIFKDSILKKIDTEFSLSTVSVFEKLIDNVVNRQQKDLSSIMEQYSKLQEQLKNVSIELDSVNEKLLQMKCQLSDKENEYNLLKAHKERIHEISNAVTLDIIRKEQELQEIFKNGYKKLTENNIIISEEMDSNMNLHKKLDLLFEYLITTLNSNSSNLEAEKEVLLTEVHKWKLSIENNNKLIENLKDENKNLKETNQSINLNLQDVEEQLFTQKTSFENLNKMYAIAIEENKTNVTSINAMKDELNKLQNALQEKEFFAQKQEYEVLKERESKINEFINTVAKLEQEISQLRAINDTIIKEKNECALELDNSKEMIKLNNIELDKMTSDILVLRESVKENLAIVENLKSEAKSLLQQNLELKSNLEEKCRYCSRLEMNIKTHEKTAEIQSKMIMRLQKQKEEDDKKVIEKEKQIEDLTRRYSDQQKDYELVKTNIETYKEELEKMTKLKESVEQRMSDDADWESQKGRPWIDLDASRLRRQSIHNSKRLFGEDSQDHNPMEAVFDSRSKPQDLFMDVDENSSNSTPSRLGRGRDSLLSSSKQDNNKKEDEHSSRPTSAMAARCRRQSLHDLHRSGVRNSLSPATHNHPSSCQHELITSKSSDIDNNNIQNEVSQLREQLASCQLELDDLKERYRELDEECETCSQYLQQRDAQCLRLKKEKVALEALVSELRDKLQTINPNKSQQEPKRTFADAFVNTDEDWANLHSVVVDRMSYDAEVEKNKRLTKTIEELRFNKQDLKNMIAKMQKHLEKNAARDNSKELDSAKSELKACKQELRELQERNKELDEECETCAQYLREREDQCRKLKDTVATLEEKLLEYQDNSIPVHMTASQRKRRQNLHDQNRSPVAAPCDASTETSDDLCYQVERDVSSQSQEMKLLKQAVDKLSHQKAILEKKLAAAPTAPMYVATGSAIVQNQQLTNVMKENQKLKKINAKLLEIYKKRGKKSDAGKEGTSEQP